MTTKKRRDWLAISHAELNTFVNHVRAYLASAAIRALFGWVVELDSVGEHRSTVNSASYWLDNVFEPKIITYNASYNDFIDPEKSTPAAKARFYQEEKEMKALFRQLYSSFIRENLFIRNEHLEAMGFPIHSNRRHQIPPPTAVVLITANRKSYLSWIFSYFAEGVSGTGRPEGVIAMEFCYCIRTKNNPPTGHSDLTTRTLDTASPVKISFNESDEGNVFYFAGRWIGTRGEPGDWSIIYSIVIA